MKLIRASHLGMCFGVRDAIDLARRTAADGPVTVLGRLVHNQTVLNDLRREGIRMADDPSEVSSSTVLITAHGASERRLRAVRAAGHPVLEATCPLVQFAHAQLRQLVAAGYHPVIIGLRDHVEVRGLTEDFETSDVILTPEDVDGIRERPKFGVVAQTTQPLERVRERVDRLRRRFPASEVVFRDTVCRPTKDRQAAALELARRCDVVVVVGGADSNNTKELVATCRRHCENVHHVQSAVELRAEWLAGAQTVGLTAGTSTPDLLIDGVERRLRQLAERSPVPAVCDPQLSFRV